MKDLRIGDSPRTGARDQTECSIPSSFRRGRHLHAFIRKAGLALCAALLTCLVFPVSTGAQQFVERPEEELLLLAVRAEGEFLADTLPAWPGPGGGVMLPLGEMARLLTLAIDVDVTRGVAQGFVVTEDRPFLLDARGGRVLVGGRETKLDPRLVEIQRDDIYVDAAALSSWLPVDIHVDLRQSMVTVDPREPLPFMLAARREERSRKMSSRRGGVRERYPVQPLDWSMAAGLAFEHQSRISSAGGGGDTTTNYQHSTFIAGDLFRQSAEVWLIGTDEDPLDQIRATLGRTHPEPELLGSLRAREYAIGEIFVPGDDLLIDGGSGPGVLVSNYPLRRTNQFDTHTIQGTGPAGWDVELYHNDALLTISRVGLDGRYEFADVPLYFGLNVFRLVFYGPQGQVREETQRLEIAEALARPGELNYRLSAADVRGRGERGELELDWGISDRLSARIALAGGDLRTGRGGFLRAGLGAYQGVWYGRIDGAVSDDGGTLVRGAVQTRIGSLSVTGELALLDDFESEVFLPRFGPMRSRARVRVDGTFPASVGAMTFSLDSKLETFAGGGEILTIGNRLSKRFGRTFVTHNLTSQIPRDLGPGFETNTQASLILSRYVKSFALRGEASYQIDPDARLNMISLQLDSYRVPGYLVGGGVQRIESDDTNRLFATISRSRGPFSWNASVSWDDKSRWTATAGLGISAIRDIQSGEWETSARSLATQGAASVRVFVDHDLDGTYSTGDEPLRDVEFFVDRASSRVTTDGNGLALLTGLATESLHEIAISTTTLEDFLMVPAKPGVSFYVRLGVPTIVELPVVMTGQIYGTVSITSAEHSRSGGGLSIELVSESGEVVHETTTAYDGFYEIIAIKPGTYSLRIGEKTRGREIDRPEPIVITIPPGGTILDGIDIEVRERPSH